MAGIQFPNTPFPQGTFSASVIDNNGAPSAVLEAAQPFKVDVSWTISALAAALLGGQWDVSVYVESIGPGPETRVADSGPIPLNGDTAYSASLVVPANTLPDDPAPPVSGVYKLVTVLTHRNFGKVTDVAGVVEGPVLRIG